MDSLVELAKRRMERKRQREGLNTPDKANWLDPEAYADDSDEEYEKMVAESKARRKYMKGLTE